MGMLINRHKKKRAEAERKAQEAAKKTKGSKPDTDKEEQKPQVKEPAKKGANAKS